MAEIAEKVADNTPSDTTIRRRATLMAGASSPKRTMTPAATEQPSPCPIKEPFPHGAAAKERGVFLAE